MKKLLLGLLILYCHNSMAQAAINWQKCFGGSADDRALSIQQTTDGGYVIVGSTYLSTDGDVSGNHGSNDVWVVKITSLGTLQWQKCYGGTGPDYGESIIQTTDGGFILSGSTQSNDGDVSGNHGGTAPFGGQDIWVVKLSSSGILQWQKCLGGNLNESGKLIQQTVDGGYILTGSTSSNNGDVTGNNGLEDGWVVKLSSSGILQWQKCLGGPLKNDSLSSIQQTPEGGYVLAGSTSSNSGDLSGNHGGYDAWVIKLSSLGILEWQKCYGGLMDDSASSILKTSDGGYIITGSTSSNNGDVTGNHAGGLSDVWAVKLTNLGILEWQKCLGSRTNDYGLSIQTTTDGGYIIAGIAGNSDSGDVSGNHGTNDAWVVKLSNLGNLQWQKCLGGTANDYGYSIQTTSDGGCIIAGYTQSNDGDVSGNHGGNDVWVIKMSNILEVIETSNESTFALYPNPAVSILNVNIGSKLIKQPYTIIDGIGRVVLNGKLNEVDTSINVEQLSKGIYYLKIAGYSANKFIKE